MTFKCVGKKIWEMALKLSEFSCSCGWECDGCRVCGIYADRHNIEPSPENKGYENRE